MAGALTTAGRGAGKGLVCAQKGEQPELGAELPERAESAGWAEVKGDGWQARAADVPVMARGGPAEGTAAVKGEATGELGKVTKSGPEEESRGGTTLTEEAVGGATGAVLTSKGSGGDSRGAGKGGLEATESATTRSDVESSEWWSAPGWDLGGRGKACGGGGGTTGPEKPGAELSKQGRQRE